MSDRAGPRPSPAGSDARLWYGSVMGEPARSLDPTTDDQLTALDPPLTDEERRALLESLAEAAVPESFRESVRRDIAAL